MAVTTLYARHIWIEKRIPEVDYSSSRADFRTLIAPWTVLVDVWSGEV